MQGITALRSHALRSQPLQISACAGLLVAGTAGGIYLVRPFDHGIWLVSYSFLVGFLAQDLLGRMQSGLLSAGRAVPPRVGLQASLWGSGALLVPAGVLADMRVLVMLGGAALLGALALFWSVLLPVRTAGARKLRWLGAGQLALIVFMAASVLAGVAMAWESPWV
jgi:hypothetical protein